MGARHDMALAWRPGGANVVATACRRGGGASVSTVASAMRHGNVWRGYQHDEGSKANLVRMLAAVRRDEVAGGEEEGGDEIRSTMTTVLRWSSGNERGSMR